MTYSLVRFLQEARRAANSPTAIAGGLVGLAVGHEFIRPLDEHVSEVKLEWVQFTPTQESRHGYDPEYYPALARDVASVNTTQANLSGFPFVRYLGPATPSA